MKVRLVSPVGPASDRTGACERCHRSRERCAYDTNDHSCNRCLRLGKLCQTRQWKRMGRKPRSKQTHNDQGTFPIQVYSLSPIPKLPPQVGESILSEEGFFQATCHFLVGKSFVHGFRRIVLQLFACSPEVLGDVCQALEESMRTQRSSSSDPAFTKHLMLGTRSLRALISLSDTASCVQDAAVLTFLGQTLLAYNALLPLGSSTRIVTRGTLIALRTWYPVMQKMSELDSITIVPVLIDTIDCLIRREIPIVRWMEDKRVIIDRCAGVSSSLLPLMYDLCLLGHQAKKSQLTPGPNDQYVEIEESITQWQPPDIPRIYIEFTNDEITVMKAQARSYRFALLLIIHRLRHPLGIEDDVACCFASSILGELEPLLQYPSEGAATGFGVDFPLLVAAIELPEPGRALLNLFERFRYRTKQGEDMRSLIDKVQTARLSGYEGLWLDLAGEWTTGDILP